MSQHVFRPTSVSEPDFTGPMRIELPRILRRRWRTVALLTALSLVTAIGYVLLKPPVYSSTARLYVEQRTPRLISDGEGLMTRAQNYLFTQAELFTSTPILALAAAEPDLRNLETFSDEAPTPSALRGMITARVSEKNDIIDVSCRAAEANEAASIVNAVVSAYVQFHAQEKRSTARQVLKILQDQQERKEAELSGKLQEMLAFKQANHTVSFESDRRNIVSERLASISDALTASQLETIEAAAALAGAEALLADPEAARCLGEGRDIRGMYVSFSDEDKQACAELHRLRMELAVQRQQFTDDAPAVRAVRGQVDELEGRLCQRGRKFLEAHLAAVQHQLNTAQARQRQLQAAFDAQHGLAQELNVKAAQYTLLATELRRLETHCDLLDGRIKELNLSEDAGALNISILEVGRPAGGPTQPRAEAAIPIGLALGLVLGAAAAMFRDLTDGDLRRSVDHSGLPDSTPQARKA